MGIPNFDDQLTQAEKDAKNFLCWSNETLGKCVRWTAQKIKDNNGKDALYINSALLVLQFGMKNANAETLKTSC